MSYTTNKEKIMSYIDSNIMSFLQQQDLDYKKVVDLISEKTSSNPSMVKTILDSRISSGKIKHISILTIPDEEVDEWLLKIKAMEDQKKKDDAEAQKILKETNKEVKNATKR